MPVDPKSLEQFEGKQVILHKITDDGLQELEGKIEAASEFGVAFKERGKRDSDLVEPGQIEEIALAPSKPKKLSQKKLKPVTDSTVRQHLLDRHGYELGVVNEMSDDAALREHDDIDHTELGHLHVAEDEDEAGEADEESAA